MISIDKWSCHLLREGKGETSVELLEAIVSNKNRNEAYLRVYKNKGANGVDGITVEELKQYLKEHKDELRQRIRTRKYQPQAALRVEILGISERWI